MRSHIWTSVVIASLAFAAALPAGCVVETAPAVRPAEAHAERNGFIYLGERTVNGGADHDVIHVGRRDGAFRQIMIVVERAPIELFSVDIEFGDGQRFQPPTRLVFGRDTTSRIIELPGGARIIRRVDFHYGNIYAGTAAKVELWAR